MAARAGQATQLTSPTSRDGRSDGGFALYELILALAIMGLVAGVVLPRIARAPGPVDLRAKAQEMAAVLRSDRNAALSGGKEIVTQVDLANGIVLSGSGFRQVQLPAGVKIDLVQSSREIRPGGGGVRFLPSGRSSGGVLYVSRGDASYEIAVNWLTSAVLVSARAPPTRSAAQ